MAATDVVSGNSEEEVAAAVDLTSREEGYSAVLYDNTNGLPTSEANAIAETSEGFLWIGSYSGLIRYDGNTFERIDSTTGVASVVSLYVDSRDRLWVGTNDNGAAVMEKGQFRMFGKADGLGSSSVRAIAEDLDGNVYIATTHGITVVDQNLSVKPLDDPQINEEYISDLRLGPNGVLYGVTVGGALFTIENGKVSGFYSKAQTGIPDIISVLPDPQNPGYVYLGTAVSQLLYGELGSDLSNAQAIDASPLAYIRRIEQLGDQVWICADNGVGAVRDGRVERLEGVPLNNAIDHVMQDYAGNLWFTSSRQGVMKIVPNQFTDVFERYNLPSAVVNSTCQYGDSLFVGTDTGLIVLGEQDVVASLPLQSAQTASGESLNTNDLIDMLAGSRIRSIVRDSKGRLWLCTYGTYGLIRYDGAQALCFKEQDGLPSDRVRTVYERQDGSIMVACTGGLGLISGNSVVGVYDEDSGLANTEILTAVEAPNGDMILGSDGDGIYIISNSKVTHLGTESGLWSGVVMRIKHDRAHNVFWIVTSNSLAYMTEDYRISTVQKFPYSNNFDLYENSKDEMWVLSSNGVYVVAVDEMLANGAVDPVYYGMDNGLPCIATANSYSALTENGDLYIAGTTGVAKVNIEVPFESVDNVKMAVPYVMADGVAVYADDNGTLTIPANTSKLTVQGFVYTYSLMNPQVSYYLDGFDQGENTVSRAEFAPVDYTNLRGGDYHFVMKLHDSMGHGNKEMSVLITKKLAIYEEPWFIVMCVIVGLALIGGIAHLYTRQKTRALQKKAEEDKLFIREIIEAFAKTIDMKDKYTNGHSKRVADYTAMLARELGYEEEEVERYYNIALLHDIGKIGVPSEVLNKPGKLNDDEFQTIKSHTTLGYEALRDISIVPDLSDGAWSHHERPDGKGYPRGLKGGEIPRVAQIIAVADAFDAMYSNRPYRKRMNFEKVVSIIQDVRGTQLTSDVVDAFMRLVEQGKFRDPNDDGGGTTEDIDNIHKRFNEEKE